VRARRNRLVLALAAVVSVGIVGAWFPVSALLHQREELAAASAQLSRLDEQNAAIGRHERQLRTLSALGRIAQEQYDLVPPGDQAYQVLPPSGANSSDGKLAPTGPAGSSGRGSSRASGRGGSSSSSRSSGSRHLAATTGGFFTRVVRTLEFWR
jgi:cell division protein FtsB